VCRFCRPWPFTHGKGSCRLSLKGKIWLPDILFEIPPFTFLCDCVYWQILTPLFPPFFSLSLSRDSDSSNLVSIGLRRVSSSLSPGILRPPYSTVLSLLSTAFCFFPAPRRLHFFCTVVILYCLRFYVLFLEHFSPVFVFIFLPAEVTYRFTLGDFLPSFSKVFASFSLRIRGFIRPFVPLIYRFRFILSGFAPIVSLRSFRITPPVFTSHLSRSLLVLLRSACSFPGVELYTRLPRQM